MNSTKILLIEDNEADAYLVREVLSSDDLHDFDIEWKDTVESGLKAMKNINYDIVITDLSLSGNKGLDTFNTIRENAPPNLPILILTGLNDRELGLKAVSMGAQDYFAKDYINCDLLSKAIVYSIERKALENRLRELSNTDDVTDLLNRRGFEFLADQHVKIAKRTKSSFCIVFFDLDHLKQINDTYGHLEGTRSIVEMSKILSNTFRNVDLIGRWGGDEFIVLAVETSDNSEKAITDRLERNIMEFNNKSSLDYEISASYGFSYFDPQNPKSLETLIKEADNNMYKDKNTKKMEAKEEKLQDQTCN